MPSELYSIEEITEDKISEWNALCRKSKQYTIFMRDDYLAAIGYCSKKYVVYRKNSICAGLCIPINNKTGKVEGLVPYAPYQGLLYSSSEDKYSDYHTNLEATEVLLDYLYGSHQFESIQFSNSIYIKDIRPILWHHYHQPEKGMYDVGVRYTGMMIIDDETDIEQGLSKGRKLDYKYSTERYGLVLEKSQDIKPFLALYEKTFSRQGIDLSTNDYDQIKGLLRLLLGSGEGELYYAINPDGVCIDATFIVYEGDRAYYLYGANDPEFRKCGGGTLLLLEQLKKMKDRGIKSFDFIGINSPYRGDYKLSFGCEVVPYYYCKVMYWAYK